MVLVDTAQCARLQGRFERSPRICQLAAVIDRRIDRAVVFALPEEGLDDLRSALANLGYGNNTIDEVAGQLAGRADDFDTIDDMLREAFKLLR